MVLRVTRACEALESTTTTWRAARRTYHLAGNHETDREYCGRNDRERQRLTPSVKNKELPQVEPDKRCNSTKNVLGNSRGWHLHQGDSSVVP